LNCEAVSYREIELTVFLFDSNFDSSWGETGLLLSAK